MVLRVGEEEVVLQRASRMVGLALPEEPKPLSEVSETDTVLALVPVGHVSIFTLHDLQDVLSKRLGIKVVVASVEMPVPMPDRTAKQQWVAQTREKILAAIEKRPELAAQVEQFGFTVDWLRANDESLVEFVRKTTRMEQGADAVKRLDAALELYAGMKQWDADKVMGVLQSAVGDRVGPKLLVLGITPHDLFGGGSNFLFGTAATGNFLGLLSVHRFRAEFNEDPPKRERLKERLLKQSLSTIGFMLGVPRCNTPECARAYPQNLIEHDQKPSTLCPACHAQFEKALGQKLLKEKM